MTDSTDCNDMDASINPDATELCDGVDNDSDGTTDGPDAEDAIDGYSDIDGDGYGDPDSPEMGCEGDGVVLNSDDCDDSDEGVNPDGTEEWYDDVDGDCNGDIDPDVCVNPPEGQEFEEDPNCTYTPAAPTSWQIGVEWSTDPANGWTWAHNPSSTRVMMTPVVGQLSDDNGDGLIDEQDIPDIALVTFSGGNWYYNGDLRVVSGDGTVEHWGLGGVTDSNGISHNINAAPGIAIGDIDADGFPDLLTMSQQGYLLAFNHDGSLKWASSSSGYGRYSYPSITDMDGDGDPEIIVDAHIFDSSGNLIASSPAGGGNNFAADLDGDGVLEHIAGTGVMAKDGTVIWHDSSRTAGQPAVMDWDGDGDGDVLNQSGGTLTVFDESGNVLVESTVVSDGGGNAPCVGDFDGDGEPEVAITSTFSVTAMETDGSTMWTVGSNDPSSGGTPCTAWDFDGDGDFEILVQDHDKFRILDGMTGAALLTENGHASGTLNEQPVPVDADRDGSTEIIVAANDYYISGWDGIYVLGELNDEWTTTRTTWNQGPFWSGNVNDDLTIPTAMDMPWDLDNSFRSQLSPTADPLASQDFQVEILGVCEDCTEGMVEVWVSPMNAGAVWGPPGVDVALYVDDGSTQTLISSMKTDGILDPGQRLAPMIFNVDVATYNSGEMVASIDDDGMGNSSHNECDESNNQARFNEPVCEE